MLSSLRFRVSRRLFAAAALVVAGATPSALRAAHDAPVSPNATPQVHALLDFLDRISGQYILSGQQEIAWDESRKEEDFDYILQQTGKVPAVRGFDFLQYVYSPSVRANQHATERAIAWSQNGGIVTFCCHMFMDIGSPARQPQFYVPSANNGVGTTFDIRQAVIAGTPENTEYLAKLDIIAEELTKLRDAGVPVIWRPFHECSGGWFWWGAHGPAPLIAAYRIMFDRFTYQYGLNNLIWVFNPTGNGAADTTAKLQAWYPGDDVADMISLDFYPSGGTHPVFAAEYQAIRAFKAGHKVVAMSENGAIPDPDQLFASGAGWSYFCTWNGFENDLTQNSVTFLNQVFNHPKVITLDELPPLFATYTLPLTTQPKSQMVFADAPLSLSVVADSPGTLTYQWLKDGVALADATDATYTVDHVTTDDAGTYSVTVSNGIVSTTSVPADVAVAPAGAPPSRLVNISTRAATGTGNNVTIGGFVLSGSTSKPLLLRAVGPTLATQGIDAAEALQDPSIEIHQNVDKKDTVIAANQDWGDNADSAAIAVTAGQLGAGALANDDVTSSVILRDTAPGIYTFITRGRGNTSGIGLVEAYDAAPTDTGATFLNISTRAYCTTGNGVTIGGFVISGTAPKRILLRAVGPTLTTQDLDTDEVLHDPAIVLHRLLDKVDTVIASNDNWNETARAAEIASTGTRVGATPLAISDTTSSALLLFLDPGIYTCIVRGRSDTSGIVLMEVYDAD